MANIYLELLYFLPLLAVSLWPPIIYAQKVTKENYIASFKKTFLIQEVKLVNAINSKVFYRTADHWQK